MRDAINLEGQSIVYNDTNYKIESFYFVPKGEIYVKLKNILTNIYLNVPLNVLIITLQQQLKL